MTSRFLFLASAIAALTAACTSHVDSNATPMWTSDSHEFTLAIQPGNIIKPGPCYASFHYVDGTSPVVTVTQCDSAGASDVTLTADEASRVHALVTAIDQADVVQCVPDGGFETLTVTQQDGATGAYATCLLDKTTRGIDGPATRELGTELETIANTHRVGAPWRDSSRLLVLAIHDGFAPHPNGNACDGDSYRYDRAAKTLHAERCNGGAKVPPQDIALSSAQVAQLEAAATGLVPVMSTGCVPDGGNDETTITDAGGATQSYGCNDHVTFTSQSYSALLTAIRAITG